MRVEGERGVEPRVRKSLLSHEAGAFVRVLLAVFLFACSVSLNAQGLAPSQSAVRAFGGAEAVDVAPGAASDLFTGADSKGPYYLTWKQIDPDTESITVDGMRSRERSDYTIDCNAGTVTFRKPLRSGSIVRAEYRCSPNKAVRNSATLNLPIDLSLLQRDSSSLHLIGLYKGAAPNGPTYGTSVVGLSGEHGLGGASGVNAMFLVSSSPDDKERPTSTWDKAALKLGGSHEAGRLRLKASFAQAGGSFAGSNEYGFIPGGSAANVAATYAASKRLILSHSYATEESVSGATKGAGKSTTEQTISYAPDASSAISAGHKVVETVGVGGAEQTNNQNSIEASHTFSGGTSATASVMTGAISSGGAEVSNETTAKFDVQSGGKVEVQGVHTKGESAALGESNSTAVSVSAKPSEAVKVEVDMSRAESDKAGSLVGTGVRVEATPHEKITLQAGMTETVASTNESDVTREARLQLRPGSWLTLTGGVRTRELSGDVSTITDVGGAVKPLKYLSLTGGYTNRDMSDSNSSLDTMALGMSLEADSHLRILGSYQRNPEDTITRQPLSADSRSVALETTVGKFSLTGGYARNTDYALRSLKEEKQFGLGIQVSRSGRVVSGFRRTEAVLGSQLLEETYSLGYSRQMGSDFSLLLSGSMIRSQLDGVYLNDRPEVQAEAKLALKF